MIGVPINGQISINIKPEHQKYHPSLTHGNIKLKTNDKQIHQNNITIIKSFGKKTETRASYPFFLHVHWNQYNFKQNALWQE